jgi:hypothetical protein
MTNESMMTMKNDYAFRPICRFVVLSFFNGGRFHARGPSQNQARERIAAFRTRFHAKQD